MQDVTPDLFIDAVNSYHKTAAMIAALDIGLFTAIAEGANTSAALAAKVGAAERGVRILADYLTIQEFMTKSDGVYALTAASATFLDRRSPAYLGAASDFLASAEFRAMVFADPAGVVRSGGSLGLDDPDGPRRRGHRRGCADAPGESIGYRRGPRNVWRFCRARRAGRAGDRAGLGRRS
jgi:hypothetical protein